MGFAIAEELAKQGAAVILISGPTHLQTTHPRIKIINIVSADEMHRAATYHFPQVDMAVLSAAVADFKPAQKATQKIKKTDAGLNIELIKNPDIAADLGKMKKEGQYIVGFALETENELANAQKKLQAKNFDLIVLNSLKDPGAGFSHDTNQVSLISPTHPVKEISLRSKKEIAIEIVKALTELHA